MTKPKEDKFFKLLEDGVRDVLKSPEASPADKLKAIDTGAKLLAIRHKIDTSEGGDGSSSFFGGAGGS